MNPRRFSTFIGAIEGALFFLMVLLLIGRSTDDLRRHVHLLGFGFAIAVFVGWQSIRTMGAIICRAKFFARFSVLGIASGAAMGISGFGLVCILDRSCTVPLSHYLYKAFLSWLVIGAVAGLLYACATSLLNVCIVRIMALQRSPTSSDHQASSSTTRFIHWLPSMFIAAGAIGFGTASLLGFQQPAPSQDLRTPYLDAMEVLQLITAQRTLDSIHADGQLHPIEEPLRHDLEAIPRVVAKDFVRFAGKASPPVQIDEDRSTETIQGLIDLIQDSQLKWDFAGGLLRIERVLLKRPEILDLAQKSSPSSVLGRLHDVYLAYFEHKRLREAQRIDQANESHAALLRRSEYQLLTSLALMAILLMFIGLKLRLGS